MSNSQNDTLTLNFQRKRLYQLYWSTLVSLTIVNIVGWFAQFNISNFLLLGITLSFTPIFFLIKQYTRIAFFLLISCLMLATQLVIWNGVGIKAVAVFGFPIILILTLFFNNKPLFLLCLIISNVSIILNGGLYEMGIMGDFNLEPSFARAVALAIVISVFSLFLYFYLVDIKKLVNDLKNEKSELLKVKKQLTQYCHENQETHLIDRRVALDFFTQISNDYATNKPHAFCYLEIDAFKMANDYGHEIRDKYLSKISEYLFELAQNNDGFFKIGVSEFLFITPNIQEKVTLIAKLKTILNVISQDVLIDGASINSSAAFGVSLFPKDGGDFESLIANADVALYESKRIGVNRVEFFDSCLLSDHKRTYALLNSFESAIKYKHIQLNYSPIIKNLDRSISGFKVGVNWEHNDYGEISNALILKTFEKSGKARQFWSWQLVQVKALMQKFMQHGFFGLDIYIQTPVDVLLTPDLFEILNKNWASQEVPLNRLVLLVDESVFFNNESVLMGNLQKLKMFGIKVAISNFASKYIGFDRLHSKLVDSVFFESSLDNDIKHPIIKDVMINFLAKVGIDTVIDFSKEDQCSVNSNATVDFHVNLDQVFINHDNIVHYLFQMNGDVIYQHI